MAIPTDPNLTEAEFRKLWQNQPSPRLNAIDMQQQQQLQMLSVQMQQQSAAQQIGRAFGIQGGFLGADMTPPPPPPYDATEYPYQNTFGEIVAWRSWKWKDGALVSPYKHIPWAAGEIIEAHESPFVGRNSGVFCHKTIEDVFHQESNNWQVVGTVLIWGEVIEHEKGYRAEFAKPYEMKHFHPDLPLTAAQYIESVFNHTKP